MFVSFHIHEMLFYCAIHKSVRSFPITIYYLAQGIGEDGNVCRGIYDTGHKTYHCSYRNLENFVEMILFSV